ERELDAVDGDGAALVRVVRLLDALLPEPAGEFDGRDDVARVLLRKVDGVADVVAVPVREADDVDALGLLLVLGALRIPVQERVDVHAFSAGRFDAKRRMAQPGECSRHAAETNERASRPAATTCCRRRRGLRRPLDARPDSARARRCRSLQHSRRSGRSGPRPLDARGCARSAGDPGCRLELVAGFALPSGERATQTRARRVELSRWSAWPGWSSGAVRP